MQCRKNLLETTPKKINLYKSKPCVDIDKCIHNLTNLKKIILCSNQIIPTNAPNAKQRILTYAKKKTKVPVKILLANNICDILINNRQNNSFEDLFKIFLPFFYETFISHLPKKRITWKELIAVCHSQVQTEIKAKIGNKYIPKLYVHREKEKEIATFIKTGTEALMALYKNLQTIDSSIFQRHLRHIVDLALLQGHDPIFLPSPDRRRKITLFLDNLSENLEANMRPMRKMTLGSREKGNFRRHDHHSKPIR